MKYEIDLKKLELIENDLIEFKLIDLLKRLENEKDLEQVMIIYDGKEYVYFLCDGDIVDERWLNMDVFGYETSENSEDNGIYWARIHLDDKIIY